MTILKQYAEYIKGLINPDIAYDQLPIYLSTKLINEFVELQQENNGDKRRDEYGDILWYIINLGSYFNFEPILIEEIPNIYQNFLRYINHFNQIIIKHYFHKKPIDFTELYAYYIRIFSLYNHLITKEGYTIERIIEDNITKLKARHGEQYNKEFYTK